MKRFALSSLALVTVAVAAPTPRVVTVPPPSSNLRSRCEAQSEWQRYGSVDVCEDEKRVEELAAFQQARLAAERVAQQSDEKILKDLGFDGKGKLEDDENEPAPIEAELEVSSARR